MLRSGDVLGVGGVQRLHHFEAKAGTVTKKYGELGHGCADRPHVAGLLGPPIWFGQGSDPEILGTVTVGVRHTTGSGLDALHLCFASGAGDYGLQKSNKHVRNQKQNGVLVTPNSR